MSQNVPPPPYQAPLINNNDLLAGIWAQWFQVMFERIGGVIALSNVELASQSTTDISTLQVSVASLQSQVSDLSALSDFNLGRAL